MKRYRYLFVLLLWSSVQFCFTSCTSDVYGDDGDIVLPPKEEVEVTPVMGSWNLKSMDADIETGNPQFNEMIKQGVMGNPLLQTIMGFRPVFNFDAKDGVTLTVQGANIPAGTYTFTESKLNYNLELKGLSAFGIPDIGPVPLVFPIEVSEDGNTFIGRLDIHFLLPDVGVDLSQAKADLIVELERVQE